MSNLLLAISFILLVQYTSAFLGSEICTQQVCKHRRGHFKIITAFASASKKDFRTFYITKDYTTRFDITFVIKNIMNLNPDITRLSVSAQTLGSNQWYYASVTSPKDKILRFKDVTSVQISLYSYEENASADVYYFMDCGFMIEQFATLVHPKLRQYAIPITKSWGALFAPKISTVEQQRTCWFVVPRDNYQGWANIDTTYVIVGNSSLHNDVRISINDVITGLTLLSYSNKNRDDNIAIVKGQLQNDSVEVGGTGFPATTVLFVDIQCSVRWDINCKANNPFQIYIKPLNKEDTHCIQMEDYCRYRNGDNPSSPLCALPPIPKSPLSLSTNSDKSSLEDSFMASKCPALNDILQTVIRTIPYDDGTNVFDDPLGESRAAFFNNLFKKKKPEHDSVRRMGTVGMCSDFHRYCVSIRVCKSQGRCATSCIMIHIRGICRSFQSVYYGYYG